MGNPINFIKFEISQTKRLHTEQEAKQEVSHYLESILPIIYVNYLCQLFSIIFNHLCQSFMSIVYVNQSYVNHLCQLFMSIIFNHYVNHLCQSFMSIIYVNHLCQSFMLILFLIISIWLFLLCDCWLILGNCEDWRLYWAKNCCCSSNNCKIWSGHNCWWGCHFDLCKVSKVLWLIAF